MLPAWVEEEAGCGDGRGFGAPVLLRWHLAHHRRNFYELATAGPAPIASEALKHIAAFYAIEKEIRGRSAEERRLVRQQRSRPLADAFEVWLRAKLASWLSSARRSSSPKPTATPSRAGKA